MQKQLQETNNLLSVALQKCDETSTSAAPQVPTREVVLTSKGPTPIGPYSQAIKANGFVFVSGCLGVAPVTGKLVEGGVVFETAQALDNLKAILEAAGSSLPKVVKTTILLKEMSHFSRVNTIYAEYFDASSPPARTTFAVAGLPLNAQVEIEAIAIVDATAP